jgi:hypothetical protein
LQATPPMGHSASLLMEARMSVSRDELSAEDFRWLEALASGGGLMITTVSADRLRELRLVDQKLGGVAINENGRRLIKTGRS